MAPNRLPTWLRLSRVLIVGLVAVIVVLGLALVWRALTAPTGEREAGRVDALASSNDDCVTCHRRTTPGIVQQYGHSSMAAAEVSCRDCHEVAADYPSAVEHENTYVMGSPSTARCERCHGAEVAQFYQSRHALPAYAAMVGVDALSAEHQAQYRAIPEAEVGPIQQRNALFALEPPDIVRFACESCHNVGRPHEDGSVGQCQKCHLRHEFSREQARKPETCNACHIGPDHPQWEIYQESPHGIAYMTGGDNWNWDAEPGTLKVTDFPAATCAVCHFSGFGGTSTTHDVGERLTWYLFAPVSERRQGWEDNQARMQSVCRQCHNANFIETFYGNADKAVDAVNVWVKEGNGIVDSMKQAGRVTDAPFDQPIDFTQFELWHHWGRTAKFGVWMQGPDYVQWHGAYEMLSDLVELRTDAAGEGAPAGASSNAPGVEPAATPASTSSAGGGQ